MTSHGRRDVVTLSMGKYHTNPDWTPFPVQSRRLLAINSRTAHRAPGPTRMTGDEKVGSARLA